MMYVLTSLCVISLISPAMTSQTVRFEDTLGCSHNLNLVLIVDQSAIINSTSQLSEKNFLYTMFDYYLSRRLLYVHPDSDRVALLSFGAWSGGTVVLDGISGNQSSHMTSCQLMSLVNSLQVNVLCTVNCSSIVDAIQAAKLIFTSANVQPATPSSRQTVTSVLWILTDGTSLGNGANLQVAKQLISSVPNVIVFVTGVGVAGCGQNAPRLQSLASIGDLYECLDVALSDYTTASNTNNAAELGMPIYSAVGSWNSVGCGDVICRPGTTCTCETTTHAFGGCQVLDTPQPFVSPWPRGFYSNCNVGSTPGVTGSSNSIFLVKVCVPTILGGLILIAVVIIIIIVIYHRRRVYERRKPFPAPQETDQGPLPPPHRPTPPPKPRRHGNSLASSTESIYNNLSMTENMAEEWGEYMKHTVHDERLVALSVHSTSINRWASYPPGGANPESIRTLNDLCVKNNQNKRHFEICAKKYTIDRVDPNELTVRGHLDNVHVPVGDAEEQKTTDYIFVVKRGDYLVVAVSNSPNDDVRCGRIINNIGDRLKPQSLDTIS